MKKHVILCSHNGEEYIEQQLQSILQQTVEIDQIHIFDFNSTDNTLAIIVELKNKNPQIKLTIIPQAHGASLSFFTAIHKLSTKISDDDLVFFSDQDDVWLPHKVRDCFKKFKAHIYHAKNQCLLIFHDVRIVNQALRPIQDSFYTGDPYQVPRDLTSERVLFCNPIIGHTMVASGKLIKIAADISKPDAYLMHDWALTLLSIHCAEIYYLDNGPYSLYRQHSKNVLGAAKKVNLFKKIQNTFNLSRKILIQTKAFSTEVEILLKKELIKKHPYPDIHSLILKNNNIRLKFLLCKIALLTGPTIKRKLLGLFLLI